MTDEKKLKLLKYLFPTDEIRIFMCNDFFVELLNVIPKKLCISTQNISVQKRKENYQSVLGLLRKFLKENANYRKIVLQLYNADKLEELEEQIIIGYVIFLIHCDKRWYWLDIFQDKRSICYSPISIVDFLE